MSADEKTRKSPINPLKVRRLPLAPESPTPTSVLEEEDPQPVTAHKARKPTQENQCKVINLKKAEKSEAVAKGTSSSSRERYGRYFYTTAVEDTKFFSKKQSTRG
ncbi:hypothetical protein L1047_02765 [Synechococcus sp. Nb3U1]|nr:hypothetical protein [Synechococcus sp. Nb3U1]